MTGAGRIYRQLAYDTFMYQWIVDIEDDARMLAICTEELTKAGYPCTDTNEDDWLEYVYAAQEIWEIATNGYIYRKEPNSAKRDGWEHVLYTKHNHPAFTGDSALCKQEYVEGHAAQPQLT